MNIVTALPGIVPTARVYAEPAWPQARMKMRNGRVQRWALCSMPQGSPMELTWEKITFDQAERLCKAWDENYGRFGTIGNSSADLQLPPEVLAGVAEPLATLLKVPFPGATWHFRKPPKVAADARAPGFCSVRMELFAKISGDY